MPEERTIEDRLREQYFDLVPEIRRVTEEIETEIRHTLLPVSRTLKRYEQLIVESRVKECESAIEAVRLRVEGATFNRERPQDYDLTSLHDLAAVRVLAFPRNRLDEIDQVLRELFADWTSDPVWDDGEFQAFKYYGFCRATRAVKGEYQIMSMLTGLFWKVEHAAIYKLSPALQGADRFPGVKARKAEVLRALSAFEAEFEGLIRNHERETS